LAGEEEVVNGVKGWYATCSTHRRAVGRLQTGLVRFLGLWLQESAKTRRIKNSSVSVFSCTSIKSNNLHQIATTSKLTVEIKE
jgi:hypothetical protein